MRLHGFLILLLFLLLPGSLRAQAPVASAAGDRSLRIAPGKLAEKLKRVWRFKTGGPISSSPVVEGNTVYVGSEDGLVYAVRFDTGKKLWSFKVGDPIEAAPHLAGNLLLIGAANGYLYALDKATGKQKWKFATEGKILGGANSTTGPGGKGLRIVIGSYDNRVYGINEAGKKLWDYETDNYINGTPTIAGDRVTFGGCDGILHILDLATGKKRLELPISDYIAGSVTVDGKNAYLGHYGNAVVCVDIEAAKVVWTYRDRGFPYFSTPAVAPDRVVIGGRDKRVHCIDRNTGKGLWVLRTGGKVDSSPTICDGKVVIGSEDGKVYLLRLTDGKTLWSYTVGRPVISSPYVINGTVVIGADDGYLYAFR